MLPRTARNIRRAAMTHVLKLPLGFCTFLFIGKNRQPDDKIQHCVQR